MHLKILAFKARIGPIHNEREQHTNPPTARLIFNRSFPHQILLLSSSSSSSSPRLVFRTRIQRSFFFFPSWFVLPYHQEDGKRKSGEAYTPPLFRNPNALGARLSTPLLHLPSPASLSSLSLSSLSSPSRPTEMQQLVSLFWPTKVKPQQRGIKATLLQTLF